MNLWRKKRIFTLLFMVVLAACIPISMAQTMTILANKSSGAFLGITMEEVTAANIAQYKLSMEKGVIVGSVIKGSPAEEAKIKENDVILEYGGFSVWSASQLSRLVQETPVDRKVDITVSRDGKQLHLSAVLKSRTQQLESNERGNRYRQPFSSKPYIWEWQDVPDDRGFVATDRKPRLGVTLQSLTDQLAEFLGVPGKKGTLIASVIDGSPSDGKLRSGDVVIAADNETINSPEELIRFIDKASGRITLKIVRDKKTASIVIELPSADDGKKGYKL